jgi:Spy/CpxP family protein refolding chaperone
MKRSGILLIIVTLLGTGTPAIAQTLQKIPDFKTATTPPLKALMGLSGMWWRDPDYVMALGLTPEQQAKMDDVFQAARLRLIDLNASLQKEETILQPLLEAERVDETKVLPQIDRVAQARAELEKSNARMLLGIREILTTEQWRRLQMQTGTGKKDFKGFTGFKFDKLGKDKFKQ